MSKKVRQKVIAKVKLIFSYVYRITDDLIWDFAYCNCSDFYVCLLKYNYVCIN